MKALALFSRSTLMVALFFVLATERGCSPLVRLTPADDGGKSAPTAVVKAEATLAPNPTVKPAPTDLPQPTATTAPIVEPTLTPTVEPALAIGEWQPMPDLPRSI